MIIRKAMDLDKNDFIEFSLNGIESLAKKISKQFSEIEIIQISEKHLEAENHMMTS